MKKIFILLTSMFLLVGCAESIALLGGSFTNGKLTQTSLQSAASYGIKKRTGETPIGHALNYVKRNNKIKEKNSCSSFVNEKDLEICLMVEKRIMFKQAKVKEKEFSNNSSKEFTLSLQSSINESSKIKYLDQ
tara:strand:+ start:723 stop:1121 length:399 start_codon:yes stop_codon:yes gene_type:complete